MQNRNLWWGPLVVLFSLGVCDASALTAQGRLLSAGGETVDGEFELVLSVYDAKTDGAQLWTTTLPAVPVIDGVFSVALDDPSATVLDVPDGRWLEIAVSGEPPLDRVALAAVPYAVSAGAIACSGCIGADQLAPAVLDGVISSDGGAMLGDLDLSGNQLLNAAIHLAASPPVPCGASAIGRVYFDTTVGDLVVCNGKTWSRVSVCDTSCDDPTTSVCGAALKSGCGDTCSGTGTGLNPLQCLPKSTPCGAPVLDACDNTCPGTGTACVTGTCVDGVCKTFGDVPATAGGSCLAILQSNPDADSGLYWIDPDGPGGGDPILVYCNMLTQGGGWTLVLHSYQDFSATPPADPDLTQPIEDWVAKGVGVPITYESIQSEFMYVMALGQLKALADAGAVLRFETDNLTAHSTLTGVSMNELYGWEGDNKPQIKTEMCNDNAGCFTDAPGFSAFGIDLDNSPQICVVQGFKIGWWYASCWSYHPLINNSSHYMGDFAKFDKGTKHHSWWIR